MMFLEFEEIAHWPETPATNICEVLAKGGAGAQKVTRGVKERFG